jgi:hypothetical protein
MTIEEIQAAITASPELRQGVLTVISGTDEGKALIKNASEAHWKDNIGNEVKNIHGHYDQVVKEVLGEEKPQNLKSSEFIKAKLVELKELKEKGGSKEDVNALKTEIEQLRKDAGNSKHWHDTYHKELPEWQKKLAEKDQLINKLTEEKTVGSIMGALNSAMSTIKLNDQIPEGVRKAYVDVTMQKLTKIAKVEGSGLVFYKEDGTIWKAPDFTPATASQVLAEELKELIQPEPRKGGGADKAIPGEIITVKEGDKTTERLVLDKSKFSTQDEFTTFAQKTLLEKGIAKVDKRFNELITKAYKEYGVAELPIK